MPLKFYVVTGLPGSGKTYWLNNVAKNRHDEMVSNVVLLDDISKDKAGIDLKLENKLSFIKTNDIYLSDPSLVMEDSRRKLNLYLELAFSTIVDTWIIFDNNLEVCLKNAKERQDGRLVQGYTRLLSSNYSLPKTGSIELLRCYDSTST